jgi:nucleotide-binding universal stress UspA family protein
MHQLLLATDGSASARAAMALASDLLEGFPAARLTAVYVRTEPTYPPQVVVPDTLIELEEEAAKIVQEETEGFFARFGERFSFVSERGYPPDVICALAESLRADLVIVGSHGRGPLARAFIGSVSRAVLNRCRVSVLVAR